MNQLPNQFPPQADPNLQYQQMQQPAPGQVMNPAQMQQQYQQQLMMQQQQQQRAGNQPMINQM